MLLDLQTLPATGHHHPLSSANLHCLVTDAYMHVCVLTTGLRLLPESGMAARRTQKLSSHKSNALTITPPGQTAWETSSNWLLWAIWWRHSVANIGAVVCDPCNTACLPQIVAIGSHSRQQCPVTKRFWPIVLMPAKATPYSQQKCWAVLRWQIIHWMVWMPAYNVLK